MNTAAKTPPSSVTGKIVVLSIFGVAIAAASFSLYWNMSRSRRALAFWGPNNVRLIQHGEHVALMPLLPADEVPPGPVGTQAFSTGSQRWRATAHLDVSKARGLIHARHALTTDASFEPAEPGPLSEGTWTHVIKFGDDKGSVFILMDFPRRRFALSETGQEITMVPKVADGWRGFVERETTK